MKHKKSHKKEKKKRKKEKRKPTSSSSSNSEEEIWVEKKEVKPVDKLVEVKKEKYIREDWMSDPNIFDSISQTKLIKEKRTEKNQTYDNILDKPGQSDRELNPYWKDGGCGLPVQKKKHAHVGTEQTVLREEASNRAKGETNLTEMFGDSVVSKMSGSFDQPFIMETEEKFTGSCISKNRFKEHSKKNFSDTRNKEYSQRPREDFKESDKSFRHNLSMKKSRKKEFIQPIDDNDKIRNMKLKPDSDRSSPNNFSIRGWKKNKTDESFEKLLDKTSASIVENDSRNTIKDDMESPKLEEISSYSEKNVLNELGAKLLKAEIMGNIALAAELKLKLEKARSNIESKDKVLILTKVDSKGSVQPLKGNTSFYDKYRGKEKRKAPTHEGGKRVRYFADDDKSSLKEMFEQEKFSTGKDQDKIFSQLARKNVGKDGGDRDMEDVFEDEARKVNKRLTIQEMSESIRDNRKREQVLENCRWCLESKEARNCIVTMGQMVYICVPTCQSLTEDHCLIVPIQHIPCVTALDENIWEEIKALKKILVKFFLTQEKDIIFFESVISINKYPHMILNCVPVPKEVGDVAPIYFKKAIMECEMEWSTNKKLVDLVGKGVRRAIPKGLPYFSVDFGLQDGYAHVVEDQKLFPNNFAQEIIGGMLDLDHLIWRKPRRETDEKLKEKVEQFKKLFRSFDPYGGNNN